MNDKIPNPRDAYNTWLDMPIMAVMFGSVTPPDQQEMLNRGPTVREMLGENNTKNLSKIEMAFVCGYTRAFEEVLRLAKQQLAEKGVTVAASGSVPETPQ